MAKKKKLLSHKNLIITIICFVVVGVSAFSMITRIQNLQTQKANYAKLEKQKAVLIKERASLEKEVKQLDDEDYVVKYARDHYIFTEDDEKAVILPNGNSD